MAIGVKICGVRTPGDARAAAQAGADAIGLNFVAASPRFLASQDAARAVRHAARASGILAVGIFVNPNLEQLREAVCELALDAVQLHGEEGPEFGREARRLLGVPLWKAYRVAAAADLQKIAAEKWPCDVLVLDARAEGDARGGTGQSFDWAILEGFARDRPLVLAGGLNPENVAEAVRRVRPDWVDAASGVESAPGVKDPAKVRAFVAAAKGQGPGARGPGPGTANGRGLERQGNGSS